MAKKEKKLAEAKTEKTEKAEKKQIRKLQKKALRSQKKAIRKEKSRKEDDEYREYTEVKKKYRKEHGPVIVNAVKERKMIRWCRFRELIKYGLMAVFFIAILAFILEGLSLVSIWGLNKIPAALAKHRAVVGCITAGLSVILFVLCYIRTLDGDDVLKGFVASGSSLFDGGTKDNGGRRVNFIMIVLTAAVFILLALL